MAESRNKVIDTLQAIDHLLSVVKDDYQGYELIENNTIVLIKICNAQYRVCIEADSPAAIVSGIWNVVAYK